MSEELVLELAIRMEEAEAKGDEETAQLLDRVLTAVFLDKPRYSLWRELPLLLSSPTAEDFGEDE